MFSYVARQGIFDPQQQIYAYELLFRDGKRDCFPEVEPDEATSKLITGSHLSLGIEEITNGKTAFINFHTDTLLYRFPTSLNPQSVVIEIVESVKITSQVVSACKHIRNLGYKIALDDHDFDPKWEALFPYADIVKVDISCCDFDKIAANIGRLKEQRIKLIAERVETKEQFARCLELGFDYFQGYFFARPETLRQKNIPSSKMILIELMGASAKKEFDYDEISHIIERDVSLSYMLFRFINNPVMNKRNEISSLSHALTYMGEVEIKKFIALVAIANLAECKPPELVHMSLVRAKFCEFLSMAKKDSSNPPKGFLVGLFSLLDALLDQDMQTLMVKLPLSEELKLALCGTKNQLNTYLNLARSFEHGDWAGVKRHCGKLELDQKTMHSFYNESIKWGSAMVRSTQKD